MSFQAAGWAIHQQFVKDPTARHVLLVLASYASKEGKAAFPSVESLMEDTGLSRRTVQYKLEHLEQLGAIKRGDQGVVAAHIHRKDKRPISYDLNMARPDIERGATGAPRIESDADLARGALHAPREDAAGCISQQSGVQMTTPRGANDDVTGRTTCTRSGSKQKDDQSGNSDARGTRLPRDWVLPKMLGEWALQTQPTWTPAHVRLVADKFSDHWHGVAGRQGRKADWEATWRNWVRREGPMPGAVTAAASDGNWWRSGTGIDEQCVRLRQPPKAADEHPLRYQARIFKASGHGPWIQELLAKAAKESSERYDALFAYFGDVVYPPGESVGAS